MASTRFSSRGLRERPRRRRDPPISMAAPSFASFPERPKPPDPSGSAVQLRQARGTLNDHQDAGPRSDKSHRHSKPDSSRHRTSHSREDDRHHRKQQHHHKGSSSNERRDKHRVEDHEIRKRRRTETTVGERNESVTQDPLGLARTSHEDWFQDLRGDQDNLRYGGISRSKVAQYRLSGAGYILGLPPYVRLQQDTKNHVGDGLRLLDMARDKVNGLSRQGLHPAPTARQLLADAEEQAYNANASYLALPGQRRHRKDRIAGITSRSGTSSSTSESDSEAGEGPAPPHLPADTARQTAIVLQRHVEAVPTDVDAWIKLSKLQGSVPGAAADPESGAGAAASRRAQSEIAHTVLSKATAAHPDNQSSIKLEMECMHHAEVLWPPMKVTARWQYLIEQETRWTDERAYMDVWLGYIAWMEGRGLDSKAEDADRGTNQGVEGVISLYADCIAAMRKVAERRYPGEAEEENLVYLILRACLFMRQAGYAERALGVMQAVLHLNFACPASQPNHRHSDGHSKRATEAAAMRELEAAWDDEQPRIGDAAFEGVPRDAGMEEPVQDRAMTPTRAADPFDAWHGAETSAMRRHWRSASATALDADIDDEDPFRVVLFSDVSDFLCYLASSAARGQLVYAAMVFLELPHAFPLAGTNTPFSSDPYLTGATGKSANLQGRFWPARTAGQSSEADLTAIATPWSCPIKSWSQDIASTLGSDRGWFSVMTPEDLGDKDANFIRHSMQSLRQFVPDVGIISASISVDYAARGIKQAVRASKALLAAERNNISLWLAYATLVGYEPGRLGEARQVLATCLQAVNKADSVDVLATCTTWAELELFKGDVSASFAIASKTLAAMSSGRIEAQSSLFEAPTKATNPAVLLRAQRAFEEGEPFAMLDLFKLKSIFTYLRNDRDATLAVAHLRTALAAIPHASPESEAAYQHLVRLLHAHSTVRSTSPGLLRGVLEEAIRLYPSNTMFLSLYLAGEARGRVYGRVHAIIQQDLLRGRTDGGAERTGEVTPITALWAVWAEAQMAGPRFWDATGGAERVRSVFRAAVEMPHVRKSALFWRLYIEFEVHQARPNQAKALCYRAVGELGACKDLYLLPFSPLLRPHFSPKELRAWADLMLERGLRVRIPFERFFSRKEESEAASEGEDAVEGEDDPFDKLHERVRLMPY